MDKYRNFEETPIWQRAHKLVLTIYEISKEFPKEEIYALTSQMKRAAVSIEANIAEAFGRYHYLDKLNFYYNSRGSVEETKSHLITCKDLIYIHTQTYSDIKNELDILGKELNKIIITLRKRKISS